MTDFATLGMDVDTTGLKDGQRELANLERSGAQAEGKLTGAAGKMAGSWRMLAGAIGAAAVALAGAFGAGAVVREAEKYELRMARINAILKATGGVAGRTADQLEAQAQALARASLESVDGIQRAQQTLLTFRNIRGEVFDEAIKSAMDLSAAIGTDLNSSILQIGKALEDPVTGMTALTRSGTVFTEAQKDMVRAMVEAGDVAKAQAFILGELQAQYGGAATEVPRLSAAQDSLAQSMENARRAINDALGISDRFAAVVERMDSAVQLLSENVHEIAGVFISAAGAITIYYAPAIWAAVTATGAWIASLVTLKGVLISTGVGALIVGAGILIGQFLKLVEATGSFGGALRALRDIAAEAAQRIPFAFSAAQSQIDITLSNVRASAIDAMAGVLEAVSDIPNKIVAGFEWAVDSIGTLFKNLPGIVGSAVVSVVNSVLSAIDGLLQKAIDGFNKLISGLNAIPGVNIGEIGAAAIGRVEDTFGGAIDKIGEFSLSDMADGLRDNADLLRQNAEAATIARDAMIALATSPLESVNNLQGALSLANEEIDKMMTPGAVEGQGAGAGGGSGGAGAGGGGEGGESPMTLLDRLLGTGERDPYAEVYEWYDQVNQALTDAQLVEKGLIEQHNAYKLEIERSFQKQLAAIKMQEQQRQLGATADFFGAMAFVFQQGGERMQKIAAIFSAAQGLINSYLAFTQALADPTIPTFGKIAAGLMLLGSGLQMVAAIRQAGSGGGGGGKKPPVSRAPRTRETEQSSRPERMPTQTVRFDFGNNAPMGAEQMVSIINDAYDRGVRIRGVMV